MEYTIMGIAFGLCLFLCPLMAYRRGLQDGLAVGQGKTPVPIKGPIKAMQEHREAKQTKQEQDKFRDGLANLLAYDGTPQEVVKE